ncbi:MAG: class I adenylate-forming enzyme family protein [Mycolicibacterium sp.]|uniref:class I adenylate-forming enzyme family protein n=1 Tax=Mycolicibacterium sp. TaxID=2320850 RepID=UPI003D0C22A6
MMMVDTAVNRVHVYRGVPTSTPIVSTTCILDRLDEWAAARPGELWLTVVDEHGATRELTFGRTAELISRLALWLRDCVGVRPGEMVAVLPGNDECSVLTILASIRAGASVFFVRPDEPAQRRAELLASVTVRAVLAPTRSIAEHCPGAVLVPEPSDLPAAPVLPTIPPKDLVFATSGSTAASKLAVQSHYSAVVNAEALTRHHGLGPAERVLGCLPICHVNGLHFTVLATLWSGAQAVLLPSFRPRDFCDAIVRFGPTIASVVPAILDQVSAMPSIEFGAGFRYFVSAAAPLTARTAGKVWRRHGVRVVQGYGLTETTNFSTTLPTDLSEAEYRSLMIDVEVPTVGVALFGNDVTVLRDDGSAAAPGEIGELCMRGHNVMRGYLDNPQADNDAFHDGWFHTGDLGYEHRGPGGQAFFTLTGRRRNMAKVLGTAVSFEEMERRLRELDTIADAACFAQPDRLRGEAIVAVVVPGPGFDEGATDEYLGGWFPIPALPARYIAVEQVPRTPTGKILRPALVSAFGVPDSRSREVEG